MSEVGRVSYTEEDLENNVTTLKSMGVEDEDHIRRVLRQTSNDITDALHILIPDDSDVTGLTTHSSSFERISGCDIEMDIQEGHMRQIDSDKDSTTVSYSLEEDRIRELDDSNMGIGSPPLEDDLPPEYDEVMRQEADDDHQPLPTETSFIDDEITITKDIEEIPTVDNLETEETGETEDAPLLETPGLQPSTIEFPLTHYYELEGRTHTDQWSIPYKREESLAVCMLATINMMKEGPGVAEADENCVKFLEKTMPSCFDKLLTHDAVYRWDESIMKGIKEMTIILLELVSTRLQYKPVPVYLLNLLSVVFNADSPFNTRNKSRRTSPTHWINMLGDNGVFAISPAMTTRKDPKGWLVEMMNLFTYYGGIHNIRELILNNDDNTINLQELTALFQPFSLCDEYINAHFFKNEMSDCMQYAIKFIEKLTDENLKDKEVGCLFDLLKTLKTLLRRCNLIDTSLIVDTLRLTMTLRMFHIPHFNAKMNALKEVVRLTEEPYSAARAGVKTPIPAEKVRSWLISNKVLSIAFGGNLHQAQYCDKVKSIVEFLGNDLSSDELHTIWDMQVDKNPAQIENIHNILAYAASRFSQQHMDILLQLIQQSWETASSDRYREKLLGLIGKIGKDDRTGRTASKILEMLWGLAHLSQLSRQMVELALNSHYSILIDSFHIKDSDKRVYIGKCVEDIKKCQWVVFAINQLHRLSKGMFRSRYGHKDQQQIADLQKQYDLLRLISSTLAKLHARAVQNCQENGETFSGDTLVDGRFTLEECVDTHLQFMHFLLQDGSLYLPFKRANEIWETLIANPDACSTDRRLGFKWFDLSMGDLELESQQNLFHKRVLRVDPLILDVAGYHCIRNFFESINLSERKLRKLQHSHQLIIDNPDLTGIDYLWKAALEVKDNYIADELISHILQITYNSLTPKLKKDPVMLHQRVIDECFTRLDSLIGPPEGYDPNLRIQCIERLLLLTQRYITMVEESHSYPRQILPHGACFQGHSIRLHVSVDQQQTSFSLQCHTNEMLSSVRRKIADRLKLTPEQLQIGTSEKWMMSPQYNKLLHQLKFDNGQLIIVKTTIIGTFGNITDSAANVERLKIALKQERLLPGVIMATERDIFSKLETLCKLEEPRITAVVRALLSLLPINQKVLEALEVFIHPSTSQGATDDTGPQPSPQHVLDSLFNASNILPTILVYNIEVLSGKLMPANRSPSETSASLFRHNFSEAGGLKCILGILQNFSSSVDSAVQQDCYAITLSLAKHLLCATPTQPDTATEEAEAVESSPHPSLSNRQLSKTKSVEDETARLIIEMMSVEDFQMTLLCLMKVCWAAVAGELHLATEKDGSRLKAGICSKCLSVPLKNIGIARESLELLVTCLKLRQSDMTIFYNLPGIEDFIMDILLGSVHYELRQLMADYMFDLCQEVNIFSTIHSHTFNLSSKEQHSLVTNTPQYFFLCLLLKADACDFLWKSNSTDPAVILTWSHSREYFDFLSHLVEHLTDSEQQALKLDIPDMLKRELDWLSSVTIPPPPCYEVQALLAGHLNLMRALFSCSGVNKESYTDSLVPELLNSFLFPASSISIESQELEPTGILDVNPKCNDMSARIAAYEVLVELSSRCFNNLNCIAKQLIDMHHKNKPQNTKEWEFRPLIVSRSSCGYVGLKNAGATCYMNSVLQQLYMQPNIKEAILSVEKEEEDTSILPDIQCIFGHLLESNLQYYTPELFWKNFRLEGQPINVLEHQDATEFFSSLTDQVDEALKKKSHPKLFEEKFGGQFLDQIICHGCEHRFEKEQGFTSLQLSVVQSKSLTESLQEFVRGDMLEGDNRYLCGECQEKRDTLKRTCIKTPPPVLVVHLKRFDYDWETNREIKFNNYFEFPFCLDLEPYTAEGITSREKGLGGTDPQPYELTGVIVHQGQASAGHYYAFIKEKKRRPTVSSAPVISSTIPEDEEIESADPPMEDRWLKFNDTLVEEFGLNEHTIESECFGGNIKSNPTDAAHVAHSDSRVRHWNAYMLFYEAVNVPKVSKTETSKENNSPVPMMPLLTVEDKLSQLQELVNKGEKRGVFTDSMPAEIQRSINTENLQFMQYRDVFCEEYFSFVKNLVFCNDDLACAASSNSSSDDYGCIIIELATKFLLHTYFRTYKELRISHLFWVSGMDKLLKNSQPACKWFVEFLASRENYIKAFLLECTSREVRCDFCSIFGSALQNYLSYKGMIDDTVDGIITSLLKLLDSQVIESWKTSAEYFKLLNIYAVHPNGCRHLLNKGAFVILVEFLLGPVLSLKPGDPPPERRWSSLQIKEFSAVHGLLSLLVRNTDIMSFETETDQNDTSVVNPYMIPTTLDSLSKPSDGMHTILFSIDASKLFIKECSLALRESDVLTTDSLATLICYCCWRNQTFSACVIEELQAQIYSVPASELKSYFKALTEVLLIEDSLQDRRINFTLIGGKYKPDIAIFKTIRNSTESKRIYQGIKFLVGLANRCVKASDFIMTQSEHLQHAVSWLRRKLNEYSWSQSSAYSFSNESSTSKVFQRTISAQDTLDEANALLNELEARDSSRQSLTSTSNQNKSSNPQHTDTGTDESIDG